MYMNEWLEYCNLYFDELSLENDTLMRQWEDIDNFYNA